MRLFESESALKRATILARHCIDDLQGVERALLMCVVPAFPRGGHVACVLVDLMVFEDTICLGNFLAARVFLRSPQPVVGKSAMGRLHID